MFHLSLQLVGAAQVWWGWESVAVFGKKTNEPCYSLEVRKNVASAEECRNLCYNKKRQENLPDCTYWVRNKLQKW